MIRLRLLLLCVLAVLPIGCPGSGDAPAVKTADIGGTPALPSVAASLEKPADLAACREILERFSTGWSEAQRKKFEAVDSATKGVLAAAPFALSAEDLRFASSADYSAADALYLEEGAFLRDVEKGLRLRSLPPAERAEIAFEWICRHIALQPRRNLPPFAVPAHTALLCGAGAPWDRTFAFLEFLRQLDLDGFAVGPPEIAGLPADQRPVQNAPRIAPVWAVGVRVEKSLLLFDPYSGKGITRADGSRAALEDLKSDDALRKKIAADTRYFPLDDDQIKNSVPFFCPPLSALAPRMKILENELKRDIRLYEDPSALLARLKEAGFAWTFWNPANDPASFVRLHKFYAAAPDLLVTLQRQSVPWEGYPAVFQILQHPDAISRLDHHFADAFIKLHFTREGGEGESPVAVLYRGSIREATDRLLKVKDTAEADRQTLPRAPNLEREVAEWCTSANAAFAADSRARRSGDPVAREAAAANLETVTRNALKPMTLINRTMAGLLAKEALYYVAQGAHDKAERMRVRALAEPGKVPAKDLADAWNVAADWWSRYRNYSVGSAEGRNSAKEKQAQEYLELAKRRAAVP